MSRQSGKHASSALQRAQFQAIRARSRVERPGPEELLARGDVRALVPAAQYFALGDLVSGLAIERERQGKSLADISGASGLTRAQISELENRRNNNPTLDTLFRYALALGKTIALTPGPLPPTRRGKAEPKPRKTTVRKPKA